ncbi:hypothetical protein [Streptococcus acidominimus]|uniref:Uncharacterized protein n=1 Tax=Streptococcus acidominimus TaxID=1326 RepID=A0A1Q8EBH3_STRAI|nr:hypothetical protein [Streptococcus acidominimus]OLF49142.1 hypothetical protein BU200_08880 [Streptococcus acidominimus]SUN06886.1 Uncharacterised protein [Streptococcus acidominimus]
MRLSRIIYIIKRSETFYLYNPITFKFIELPDFDCINKLKNITTVSNICLKKHLNLVIEGFWIDDEFSEINYLRYIFNDSNYSRTQIVIETENLEMCLDEIYASPFQKYIKAIIIKRKSNTENFKKNVKIPILFKNSLFLNGVEYKIVPKITSDLVPSNLVLEDIIHLKYYYSKNDVIHHIPGMLQEQIRHFIDEAKGRNERPNFQKETLAKRVLLDAVRSNEEWNDEFF